MKNHLEINEITGNPEKYLRWALYLAIFTIIYNLAEGLASLLLGIAGESFTLFGFGTDSLIEVISGLGILRMVTRLRARGEAHRTGFEKQALRVTGAAFYVLAAGLLVTSCFNLYSCHKPGTTFWGIVISLVSIVIMALLLRLKLAAGRRLGSAAIIADAHCTRVCIYMSVVLLAASLVYELTGLWWTDILGTLGLAWFSFSEGRECFEKARTGAHCSCKNATRQVS